MNDPTEVITVFPLVLTNTKLNSDFSSIMKRYADKHKTDQITSDISGDSYYHNNEEFTQFFEEATQCVKNYCEQIGYNVELFDFYVTRSWINNFDNSEGTISQHTHTPSDISICYYPEDSFGPVCFNNTYKPNEVLQNSFLHDQLFSERTPFSYNYVYIKPQRNHLLVFPSKASHWVDRVSKEVEHRVSFSADFIMVLKDGGQSYEHIRNPISTWRKF